MILSYVQSVEKKIVYNPQMIIAALDFGSAAICNTDYLEVYDAVFNGSGSTASRRLITRYCGNVSAKKGEVWM